MGRAEIRSAVAQLLDASGQYQVVYDHQPTTFSGQSPVATVHGGPVKYEDIAAGYAQQVTITLLVTHFVVRTDPNAAEDTLDALLAGLNQVVAANRSGALWNDLQVIEPTEPDYFMVEGKQYRGEIIRVTATLYP